MDIFWRTDKKYVRRTGIPLRDRLKGACCFHDEGKKNKVWQEACQKDYDNFQMWLSKNPGKTFEDYEKNLPEEAGKYLRKTGVRHEIFSLIQHENSGFSNFVKVAIAAHHAKLNHKHADRWLKKEGQTWNEGITLWKYFKNLEGPNELADFKEVVSKFYQYAGVRSYLQVADHRASAKEANSAYPAINRFKYAFNRDWKLRPVQEIAAMYWEDDLLLLRAPTGAGKTDAACLWASKQIENGRADRLVIAMPTRFTSNALAISTAESLSSNGLYHSSAWYNRFYQDVKEGRRKIRDAKKEHELARLLLTPVTVCTIDHLLMAMTLSREDHHTILFNLANSCVVIDEADFYDEFTQGNILVLLEFLKLSDVPVMIMSASLPESSLEMYRRSGYKIEVIREDVSDLKRPRCDIKNIRQYSQVPELDELLDRCVVAGSAIIYANTVARAIEFYNWFEKRNVPAILYHSRFTEPDKLSKETELLKCLGKEAWAEGRAKGIAILTQIGEMSVNISADIMVCELCPIDRLVQRVGRLCRFDRHKVGELHIVVPQKDELLYPAPYGRHVKGKGWEPNGALIKTLDLLELRAYSAEDFVRFVNTVYEEMPEFSERSKDNAKKLKRSFLYNWVIGQMEIPKEDDNENTGWKSRDISGNDTVFVKWPENGGFSYWSDFQAFKCENSIDLPIYLIEMGRKNNQIDVGSVNIKNDNDTEKIYFVREGFYNAQLGLISKEFALFDNRSF